MLKCAQRVDKGERGRACRQSSRHSDFTNSLKNVTIQNMKCWQSIEPTVNRDNSMPLKTWHAVLSRVKHIHLNQQVTKSALRCMKGKCCIAGLHATRLKRALVCAFGASVPSKGLK